MKKLIALLFIILFSCSKTSPISTTTQKEKGMDTQVYLTEKNTNNFHTISERYRFKYDLCQIDWNVITDKKDETWGLILKYSNKDLKERKCLNFKDQIKSHQKVLNHIFKKYDTSKLTWISTPGLEVMNPSGDWTVKVAQASMNNLEWIDYTKNYPNHKNGKSSNKMLEEELNKTPYIMKEFLDLFKQKFVINVSGVEKVFSRKEGKQTVFYDAGMIGFELIEKNN